MNPRVLRRFIFLMVLLTVGMFVFWDVIDDYVRRAPGDFETEMGSNRLVDGKYDEAIAHFNAALEEAPNHRGAMMGRALVFIQTDQYEQAIAELDYLIDYLKDNLEPDDSTGIGTLAAAYANRGIVNDRLGQYEEAIRDYATALRIDEETVDGPNIFDKIVHGVDGLSTVRDRATYLVQQMKLPEEERLLHVPEIDAKQRMYKP